MTPQRYYRAALLLPVIVPVVVTPLVLAMPQPASSWLAGALFLPALALIYGGIPYVVLALVTLWRMRGRSAEAHWTELKRLPMVYAFVVFATFVLWIAISGRHDLGLSLRAGAEYGGLIAGFGVGVGYIYVLVAAALFRMLRAGGIIEGPTGGHALDPGRAGGAAPPN